MTVVTIANVAASDKYNWQLDINKNGVKVYTAPVEGYDIKAFRGSAVYNDTTLSEMLGLIQDMDHFHEWVHGALKASVIKKISETEQACYYVNKVPILKNRDGVIVQSVSQDPDSLVVSVTLSSQPKLVKRKSQFARITHLAGVWQLKPLGNKQVELTYQLHLDPGGLIPDQIVNIMLKATPYNTLVNLGKQLKRKRYANLQVPHIQEP